MSCLKRVLNGISNGANMPSGCVDDSKLVSQYAAALDIDGLIDVFCDEGRSTNARKSAVRHLFNLLVGGDPLVIASGKAFIRFPDEVLDKMATADFVPERQRLLLGEERAARLLGKGDEPGLAGIEANPKYVPKVREMAKGWRAMLGQGEDVRKIWNSWQDTKWAKVPPAKLRAWLA